MRRLSTAPTASALRAGIPPDTGTGRSEKTKAWLQLPRFISGAHVLALADQGVVSAASFLTTVIIGRWTNASQLGIYAIGISVLASSYTIQGSLITLPYSIQRHRPLGTPAEHAGSSLAHSGLLAAAATIVLMVTALGLFASGAQPELTAITWALAGVMPFALLREFGRRYAFTHLQLAQALVLDVAVAVIQLSILGWLGWTGRMSAVTAFGAIGVSCGLASIGWFYLARGDFALCRRDARATMKLIWGLGNFRQPDYGAGATLHHILAVGGDRRCGGYGRVCRVHEHRGIRKPCRVRALQYFGTEIGVGLEGRGRRWPCGGKPFKMRCCSLQCWFRSACW